MAYTWDEMIAEFRALGGTADNIVQASGPLGRGIFPIDRDKPIRLHVPENLLIPSSDIEFVEGRIGIKDSTGIGQPEREFFEKYQQAFSWGIARAECATHIEAIRRLPPDVAEALNVPDGLERKIREGQDLAGTWYLQSRCIKAKNTLCVMPVMELVNHGIGVPGYNCDKGVFIEGQFSDEVLVRYFEGDPLAIFLSFGFASPERRAFSLPASRKGPRELIIKRNINFESKRGTFSVPTFKVENDKVTLSCMMIGRMEAPRLSKGLFVSIMKEAGTPNPEAQFDSILRENRLKFLKLLGLVEPVHGQLGQTLRTMIRYQLEAMSHCVGMRDVQPHDNREEP
jgi:hypothetical protein